MAVDLAKAKQHLNITFDHDDELISRLIGTAGDFIVTQLGYGNGLSSSDPIDQARLMLVAHWYANREATLVGVNAAPLPFGF